MNYPTTVKKAFHRVRFQVHDAWQNLRLLKRHIICLVRSIDEIAEQVNRSRRLVQEIAVAEKTAYSSAAGENRTDYPRGGLQ